MRRHHGARGHAAHQRFIAAAVLNQIGNRADLQPVLRGEKLQIGQPRHRAVGIHDFANHGSGRAAGHARQIAPGLGVPGAHQHAALHGLNGKHMPRLHQVLRPGLPRHRRFDGARAISRRNAGGHALGRLDGSGKGRAITRAVVLAHGRQAQLLAALLRERQANQPARVRGHEVDGLRRHEIGRQHQIALVLAVFLVHQNHHAAGLEFRHDFMHWRNTLRHRLQALPGGNFTRGCAGSWKCGDIRHDRDYFNERNTAKAPRKMVNCSAAPLCLLCALPSMPCFSIRRRAEHKRRRFVLRCFQVIIKNQSANAVDFQNFPKFIFMKTNAQPGKKNAGV